MEGRAPDYRVTRALERRVERKGLRPRYAAAVIAVLWAAAIIVFGIVEHLVDPDSFGNVWEGMWWATQTVTTVGYGDAVPDHTAGKIIASVLMIGGLSLFAVITAVIASAFVSHAQAARRAEREDLVMQMLERLTSELQTVRIKVERVVGDDSPGQPPR